MAEPPFDLERAHHWFAVEFNNHAWDLVEAAKRSAEETERMIHLAHAACVHWLAAGSAINHLRAQCLLATAYEKAGLGEAAVRHAEQCLELFAKAGEEATLFDQATAFGCASAAYACNGQSDKAKELDTKAKSVAAKLDPDDRAVFDKLYARSEAAG